MMSRHAFTLQRRLLVTRFPTAAKAVTARAAMSMYNPVKFDAIDPDKIFDEIDVAGTGTISREEFKAAVSNLRNQDLLALHEAAAANLRALDTKLETLDKIEEDLNKMKTLSAQKQQAYNNIGMTTAADLDALFDEGRMARKRVQSSVSDLKDQLSQTRDAYNNIGMTTAAEIEELFHDNDKKAA